MISHFWRDVTYKIWNSAWDHKLVALSEDRTQYTIIMTCFTSCLVRIYPEVSVTTVRYKWKPLARMLIFKEDTSTLLGRLPHHSLLFSTSLPLRIPPLKKLKSTKYLHLLSSWNSCVFPTSDSSRRSNPDKSKDFECWFYRQEIFFLYHVIRSSFFDAGKFVTVCIESVIVAVGMKKIV